jgi:thiol-disulfide isomerase/thioredoxin
MLPDALLLVGPGCPHCAAMLEHLGTLVKDAVIGRLEVVNVAAHPELAAELGVRSVPWVRLGGFELDGAASLGELRRCAEQPEGIDTLAPYFLRSLKTGKRVRVEALAREKPVRLLALIRLLEDPNSSMAIRLGVGAVLEELRGTDTAEVLIPGLGKLTKHADSLVRADAAHYLSLIGHPSVMPYLQACAGDEDETVREVAQDGLAELGGSKQQSSKSP